MGICLINSYFIENNHTSEMAKTSNGTTRELHLPILQRIKLSHFSLYTLTKSIEFSLDDNIVCLVGANGLGKSTFLQVVTYGLTGVVPKLSKKFSTVEDYYRDSKSFTREYFDGRILPEDWDLAEIELQMMVGNKQIIITRGFVESESLRSLQVQTNGQEEDFSNLSPEERQQIYEKILTEQIGLESFRELVFLQCFVFTFDERRHLLFWDPKVLETCLLLFLGVDKRQRTNVEKLRRDAERSASRVRNLSYDIKQTRDRLAELESLRTAQKSSKQESKTFAEFKELGDRLKEASETVVLVENKIRDAKLAIADSAARSSALRNEYSAEFRNRLASKKLSRHHPVVQQALTEERCAICGAIGSDVAAVVKGKLSSNRCPLCDSLVSKSGEDAKLLARLKDLDDALAREKKILESKSLNITQLESELAKRLAERDVLAEEMKEFESAHKDIVNRAGRTDGSLTDIKQIYEQQIKEIARQRDTEREQGRKLDQSYKTAQRKLEQQYLNAREAFVPLFNSLAQLFLGVELDISLETKENVSLVLEIRKTKRRAEHQLSESQRFFIDIALRMAFAQLVSPRKAGAPLYIDTPEGSLDLAYENQAGEMIAKFARDGHKVLMTANVNTSQLLVALATKSGKKGFGIQRLYTWTEMSTVQESQEAKFGKTLGALERAAKGSSR